MRQTPKLVSYLGRAFDLSPQRQLALTLNYDDTFTWMVADEVLTTAPAGGPGPALSIDLSAHTIASLVDAINDYPAYHAVLVHPVLGPRGAWALIDASNTPAVSNGDHVYAFRSLLWGVQDAFANQLGAAAGAIQAMLNEMRLAQTAGTWLDLWASYFIGRRMPGEVDSALRNRIIATVGRRYSNNTALEQIVKDLHGTTVNIVNIPHQDNGVYPFPTLTDGRYAYGSPANNNPLVCAMAVNFGGQTSCAVVSPVMDTINRYRAAGTIAYSLGASNLLHCNVVAETANDTTYVAGPQAQGVALIDCSGAVTIPALAITDVSVNEAVGLALVTVTKTGISDTPSSVSWATADDSAAAGTDYVADSGTLLFLPADTSRQIAVSLVNDGLYEHSNQLLVDISNPVNATIDVAQAVVTITNDDPAPVFSVADAEAGYRTDTEIVFTVTKVGDTRLPATVDYATADGSATAPADYTATSGTLMFGASETVKTVPVPIADIIGDMTLHLSNPVDATLGDASATGIIYDAAGQFATSVGQAWQVPQYVTSVCVLVIGRGGNHQHSGTPNQKYSGCGGGALSYSNNVPVTPGESLDLVFASGQVALHRAGAPLVQAQNGANNIDGGQGGSFLAGVGSVRQSGGNGGLGVDTDPDQYSSNAMGGGGGAAGYSGPGGDGSDGNPTQTEYGESGSGGGGSGGGNGFDAFTPIGGFGGGGVGDQGQGASGQRGYYGMGGSGGQDGGGSGGYGGDWGGGAGAPAFNNPKLGGDGRIRIIWGAGRSFPFNAADV